MRLLLLTAILVLLTSAVPRLAGNWTYDSGRGAAHITQSGSRVSMRFFYPVTTPAYLVSATLKGRALTGNWRCITSVCRFGHGKWRAMVDPTGNTIVVSGTEDPGDRNEWNRTVLTRAAPATASSTTTTGKPCYVNTGALASVAPCFGPIGTTIVVTVLRSMTVAPSKLRFDRALASGTPGSILQTLQGSGSTYTTSASQALCAGPGFPKKWSVWLIDANGRLRGEIGEFTATGCP